MVGPYINDPGYEVPDNTILAVPHIKFDKSYKDIIESLRHNTKRDWFNSHFYYCMPINIGNQYGFIIKSLYDFDMIWDGTFDNPKDVEITFHDERYKHLQDIHCGFSNGVVTIQNSFALKTPPGINLMTIQPPNMFIPGCIAMTAVIETDQIRRDFTFNIKITIPNYKISVKKGDALGAFIPIPRYFVDNFKVDSVHNFFSEEIYDIEKEDMLELGRQRQEEDKEKPHESGRKYFNGIHAFGEKYKDHQKRIL
jgi:hypothetical protein